MNRDEAQARMLEVQRIMERTTLYTLLPGAATIIGGLLALAGCAVSYAAIRSLDFYDIVNLSIPAQVRFCVMWTAIGFAGIALEVLLTARAARKQGISPKARPFRFALFSLSPSVIVAMVFTLKVLLDCNESDRMFHLIRYIVPIWMMCYGTGVYAAGLFSVRLPRLLGLAFILTGAVGLVFFPEYGVLLAALSFGLLHILFGIVVFASRQSRES